MQMISFAMQRFYASTSGCSVVLKEYDSKMLEELLKEDAIDLALDQVSTDASNFISIPIAEEKILLAAPESYAFDIIQHGEYPYVSISELADKPVILLYRYYSDAIFELYNRIKITPSIIFECQNLQMAHSMVAGNVGVTLLPEYSIKRSHFQNVRYYTLCECPLLRSIGVVYKKDRALSKDADIFISVLKEACSKPAGPADG